ncbi:MAG TPA: NAD(P)H-binding protein [Longimicrobium sp.]|nr:NAD(P)H-binding protein [Longimicrobium sp.]
MDAKQVFVTGGTGYIGRRLVEMLAARGHAVRALVRPGSEEKAPRGCEPVIGHALDRATFARFVRRGDTFVQLVGTPHPSPSKAAEFRSVDLVSVTESAAAAREAGAAHFVYVSVAQPAAAMRAYVEVRARGEAIVRETGIAATFLRPWYVLGPGHRWPVVLLPLYRLLERVPATREAALRLGLVTLDDMLAALVEAVENPPAGERIVAVPEIRGAGERIRSRSPSSATEMAGA